MSAKEYSMAVRATDVDEDAKPKAPLAVAVR